MLLRYGQMSDCLSANDWMGMLLKKMIKCYFGKQIKQVFFNTFFLLNGLKKTTMVKLL